MPTRDRCLRVMFALSLAVTLGCKEEQTGVLVDSLSFDGNKAVSDKQLKSVLATGASSNLPWGVKRYFSREQFEADLKRARRLDLEAWRRRPLGEKAREHFWGYWGEIF